MERTAIFVDAGWLLAAAALEVQGAPSRDELACDYSRLIASLGAHVDAHSGGVPCLRTYWYDGARGGAPSYEHDRVAGLPYVKLRLGRLSATGQQKGVDVLIYTDLMTLARERAITRAYLVGGDEDLREGVAEAQKLGVQVVLLGMPISDGHNQSARLVREADEFRTLPREAWSPHFRLRTADDATPDHPQVTQARQLGDEFARRWVATATPEETRSVLAEFPRVPPRLDSVLLAHAEATMGSLRSSPDLKTEVRGHFWFALKELATAEEVTDDKRANGKDQRTKAAPQRRK